MANLEKEFNPQRFQLSVAEALAAFGQALGVEARFDTFVQHIGANKQFVWNIERDATFDVIRQKAQWLDDFGTVVIIKPDLSEKTGLSCFEVPVRDMAQFFPYSRSFAGSFYLDRSSGSCLYIDPDRMLYVAGPGRERL